MYVLQITNTISTHVSTLFAYIKVRFYLLFIDDVELRIHRIESNEIV